MTYMKMFLAVAYVVAAQITIASAQTSAEIERVTAAIAKAPENDMLYVERGFLYTWKNKWIGPDVPFADIGKTIDDNRAKALADAEKAITLNSLSYRPVYLRAVALNSIGRTGDAAKDFAKAAALRGESNIVANIYTFDLAGGVIITPKYDNLPALNVIMRGEQLGRLAGYDTLAAAKEAAQKLKQPQVIRLNNETKKLLLYEAFITENVHPNTYLAETPFRKAMNGGSKIPLTYEALKIEAAYSVQPLPKIAELDKFPTKWQLVDIVDASSLSLLKSPSIQLLRGSKGVRLLFDQELRAGNFDEALKIYDWYDMRNTETGGNDLDVVKITRKTNLAKIYQYAEKLRPLVEKEMSKWNYAEADKTAVRGEKPPTIKP